MNIIIFFQSEIILQLWELWVLIALYCYFNCLLLLYSCSECCLLILHLFHWFLKMLLHNIISSCWKLRSLQILHQFDESDFYKFYINLINKNMTTRWLVNNWIHKLWFIWQALETETIDFQLQKSIVWYWKFEIIWILIIQKNLFYQLNLQVQQSLRSKQTLQ